MNKKIKLQTTVIAAYAITLLLSFVFALYMGLAEHSSVYQARAVERYETVENYTELNVEDPSAPIGIRKEYTWELSGISTTKDCLAFYVVHSYAQVYINDELIYSLMPGEDNRIGSSPSSNWVFIPLDRNDNGQNVKVIITPVYKSAANRKVEFMFGSLSDIILSRMRIDLPQIILSSLCAVLGLVLIVIQPIFILKKKLKSWEMFYLGNFLLLIGIWRITDTRFSPIIFSDNPMALGYITITALFISHIPLLLSIKEYFAGHKKTLLLHTALIGCIVVIAALACQVFQVAELREMLTLCHIMLIISIAVILLSAFINNGNNSKEIELKILVMVVVPGAFIDIIYYYFNKTSSGIMFTVLSLLIYTFILFIVEVFNISTKIYIDGQTGLFNRNRWNDLTGKPDTIKTMACAMMFDLNGLKYVNDTMGHKMGDKMIIGFADILRKAFSNDCMVFRWGGDEFTVLVPDANRRKIDEYISEISSEVEAHNLSGEKPEIHFAVGYALSADYPELSNDELMKKADEKMYHNKSEWYRKNIPIYRR